MELDPDAFNVFLDSIGQDVLWRRASMCPCRDPHSGAARPGCQLCGARGIIWEVPVPASTGVASMKVKREWASFAAWESGDEILTIQSDSPLYACGENDRVVMIDSSEPFQNILMRPIPNSTRPSRFPTRLPFPVASIDLAYWLNDEQTQTIEGPLPTVDADGNVTWPENAGPPDGTQFSLRGRKHQEYYMFADLPRDRHHFHGLDLPRNVQFRRWSLFGQADKR